jgi:hypothetical protein
MDDMDVHRVLPFKKVMTLGAFRVGLIHGKWKLDIQKEMIRKEFDNVDLIVYGHSHTPFWGSVNGTLFLNPGSPTDKRYAPYNSVAILNIGDELRADIVKL